MGTCDMKIRILLTIIVLPVIIFIVYNRQVVSTISNENSNSFIYIDTVNNEEHSVYELNLDNNRSENIFTKNAEGYPTSAFSKKNNKIYFTKMLDDKSTQLFEKDLSTNETKQLTRTLGFVDFIELDSSEKSIYMRVLINNNDRNFHIASYNIKSSEISIWEAENKDSSVVFFDFNPKTNLILTVTKSIAEEFKSIDNANKNNAPPTPTTHKLMLFNKDGEVVKELLILTKFIKSVSLSNDGKSVLINYKDSIEPDAPSKIAEFKDGEDLNLLIEESKENSNIHQPIYDKENKGFYFVSDKGETELSSSLKYFSLNNKSIKELWASENSIIINIYQRD